MTKRPRGMHLRPHEREALRRALLADPNRPATEIADELGVGRDTAQSLRRQLETEGSLGTPQELRDQAFWRRKSAASERRADEAEKLLRELAGMSRRAFTIPQWVMPVSGRTGKAVGLLHLSDLHVGEVVRPEEIGGVNRYDPETFQRRFRRLITAARQILPRWAADCDCRGLIVALNGDLISGDIHDELSRTNALTSHEQVDLVAGELVTGIEMLAAAFGRVMVMVTPGNHGRTTHKPHAKRMAALNYDTLIGTMIARQLEGHKNVAVNVASGPDLVYPVLGWNVLQTHGDSSGTSGGMGFAGPDLPIVRGGKKIKLAGFASGEHYDIILSAHYHKSSNPGNILANGSMVGFNEFAQARIRAEPEPPQQWLALIHDKWGLRERMPIVLEDPRPPERPRIRVPAGMS